MAINLVDSGSTISLEFTIDYNAGRGVISATKIFINKDDFEVSSAGTYVIIRDKDKDDEWKILYSDITTPSGASASAVAALIEAFQDTSASTVTLAAGTAEIGNVKNSGTFVVQENGAALTALQLIDNAVSGAGFNITQLGGAAVPIGAGTEAAAVRVTLPTDGTGVVKLGAGEAHVGELGGKTVIVNGSFTRPSDTNVYAANDVICNSTSAPVIITFSGCARVSLGSGEIQSCVLTDSGNETLKLEGDLFIFDTTVTMDNDNAAFTPTDAEMATCLGVITFSASSPKSGTAGTGGNCQYPDSITKAIPFVCLTSTNLYGILVARNAYVPISAEVFTFRLGILQN